jgi:hypothetical protein
MDAVYLVLASNSGRTELWAATGSPGKALAEVRNHLPSGWMLTLSGECLLPEAASSLGIIPGEVQNLSGDLLDPSLKLAFENIASVLAQSVHPQAQH